MQPALVNNRGLWALSPEGLAGPLCVASALEDALGEGTGGHAEARDR